MFFSVIAAYVIAAAFAFCGVINMITCISNATKDMGYPAFIAGLAIAMWPLAVAMALVMLVQIACLIERLIINGMMRQYDDDDEDSAIPPAASRLQPRKSGSAAGTPPPYGQAPQMPAYTPPVMSEKTDSSASAQEPREQDPAPQQPAAPRQEGLSFFKLD